MLLDKLFGKQASQAFSTEQFWTWFSSNEKNFFSDLKKDHNCGAAVIDKIVNKLQKYHPDLFGLIGFYNDNTLELIITPDGYVKNFVFAKELVDSAPTYPNWKFTYLKPEAKNLDFTLDWESFCITKENLWFSVEEQEYYPDEICLKLVYDDFKNEQDYGVVFNGLLIFLDNGIGELNMATKIDHIELVKKEDLERGTELIPIEKLPDYLNWREKEFLQKYDLDVPVLKEEEYAMLEAEIEGVPYLAVVNRAWKDWSYKQSFSWCVKVVLKFKGDEQGLPANGLLKEIQEFEDKLLGELSGLKICHVARSSHNNQSIIYLYSDEYLEVSKKVGNFINQVNTKMYIEYHLFRDKYWRTVEDFLR